MAQKPDVISRIDAQARYFKGEKKLAVWHGAEWGQKYYELFLKAQETPQLTGNFLELFQAIDQTPRSWNQVNIREQQSRLERLGIKLTDEMIAEFEAVNKESDWSLKNNFALGLGEVMLALSEGTSEETKWNRDGIERAREWTADMGKAIKETRERVETEEGIEGHNWLRRI